MRALWIGLLVVLAGCATTGSPGGTGDYDRPITRAEIEGLDYETAYDVVYAERRRWLQGRGSPTLELDAYLKVYVNGMRRGGPEELRNVPASAIREIRYYDSHEATMRFGTGHPEGAIDVVI